jgi:hypothetical protein
MEAIEKDELSTPLGRPVEYISGMSFAETKLENL